MEVATDLYFECLEDFEIPDLNPGLAQMLEINLYEWLLAEGEIEVGGQGLDVFEVLTSRRGPTLSRAEREALRELAERPLRLYEVVAADPGAVLVVRDVAAPDAQPITVEEKSASRTLAEGDLVGLRLVRRQRDDAWISSGAIYPLERSELQPLREEIRKIESEFSAEIARDLVSDLVIGTWLLRLDPQVPKLVDRETGEPILFTTDHYRIHDEEKLRRILGAQEDVEELEEPKDRKDRKDRRDRKEPDPGWARIQPQTERLLCELSIQGDRLTISTRTRGRADDSRQWIEALAGESLTFRLREHSDPLSAPFLEESADGPSESEELPEELYEQVYRRIYADWADEPIPVLEGATPREALATPLGKERVIELLLGYDHSERRKAASEGREPISFDFLWEQLGLERA